MNYVIDGGTPGSSYTSDTGPGLTSPGWLSAAAVKDQLRISGDDDTDDALILRCIASTEVAVQRARSDCWITNDYDEQEFQPDAEVLQAAVMLAARLVRRRNSPGGIESFGDSVQYVARYDPEISRALHSGTFAMPRTG